jgi:pathogenesis-related protein 1
MTMTRNTKILCLAAILPGFAQHGHGQEPDAATDSAPPPAGEAAAAADGGLSASQEQALLERHNHWRAAVGVGALSWSPELAAFARAWADELARQGCTMRHRPREGAFAQKYGENLYHASPVSWSDGRTEVQQISPEQVVDLWDSEKADYDPAANACAEGRMCGHYTQLVWAQSMRLGCSMKICDDRAQLWVCNYDPPGNVTGQRPY